MNMEIIRDGFSVILDEPILYVDNKSRFRSGHMSHALAQYEKGKFIDFNSNCSALRWDGHSPYGWIEYRISEDAGKTYSDVFTLPYSIDSLNDGIYVISVEKAVAINGTIVAFCLRSPAYTYGCCSPLSTPTIVRSFDGGMTWTSAYELCERKGRVFDAIIRDGAIYALMSCGEEWAGKTSDDCFVLYKSIDNGESFQELSVLPIDFLNRGYGALIFDKKGDLHAYALNDQDVCNHDHTVSHDNGVTWDEPDTIFFKIGANNPQIALIDDVFIMHGRSSKCDGYVLYTSLDAVNWDNGTYIAIKKGLCYYSNHLNLTDDNGEEFLLLQYSEVYNDDETGVDVETLAKNIFAGKNVQRLCNARVNVMHRVLKIKR